MIEIILENDLRILSSDITMLAEDGVQEQLCAILMGWC